MKIVETLLIVIAILGFAHSAHAHGIAGNRFFQGRFRLMILLLLTSQYCLSSQVPSTQMKGATSSITGLPGLFFVYSLQRSESVSIVDGFTANGAAPGARASIQRILRSRARFIGTICMRRWCRRGWPGGSATRALKELAPMHLI